MVVAVKTPAEGQAENRVADTVSFLPAIAAVCLVATCVALNPFFVLPLAEEFNATRGAVLFALGFGSMGFLLVMPVVGRLLTIMKPWVIMAVGACVACGALLTLSIAPSLVVAGVAVFAVQAVGAVLCGPITFQTIVARRMPRLMGSIIGVQVTLTATLGIGLPLVVAPFLLGYGWRATAAVASALVLIVVLPLVLTLVRRLNAAADAAASRAPMVLTAHEASPSEPVERPPTSRQILSTPEFWLLLLAMEPFTLTYTALWPNLIPFFNDRGVGLNEVSYLLSIIGIISACGAAVSGIIVDRLGAGRYIMLSSALGGVGLVGLASGIGDPAIWVCLVFASLTGLSPISGVATSEMFGPAGFAPAVGLIAPFMVLSALGGAGAGWAHDEFGSYQPVFAALCVGMVVAFAAGMMFFLRARKRAKLAPAG